MDTWTPYLNKFSSWVFVCTLFNTFSSCDLTLLILIRSHHRTITFVRHECDFVFVFNLLRHNHYLFTWNRIDRWPLKRTIIHLTTDLFRSGAFMACRVVLFCFSFNKDYQQTCASWKTVLLNSLKYQITRHTKKSHVYYFLIGKSGSLMFSTRTRPEREKNLNLLPRSNTLVILEKRQISIN